MKQPSGANDRLRLGIVEHCPARTLKRRLQREPFLAAMQLCEEKMSGQGGFLVAECGLAESQSNLVDGE